MNHEEVYQKEQRNTKLLYYYACSEKLQRRKDPPVGDVVSGRVQQSPSLHLSFTYTYTYTYIFIFIYSIDYFVPSIISFFFSILFPRIEQNNRLPRLIKI
jgi:hypothetical protein